MGYDNKTLLITNYWYPFNTPGSIRWIQFGRYLDFDVLTCKKPRGGFIDESLPMPKHRNVFRRFRNLPAVLFGIFIIPFAVFARYDTYIVTIPPFTLSLCALVLQSIGRKVVLDIRDNQANKKNYWKPITWLCGFARRKVRHRVASFQFLDPGATRVLSGYNPELYMEFREFTIYWMFMDGGRISYKTYIDGLSQGFVQDYRKRMKYGYAASSFVNLLYLDFKDLPMDGLHPECVNQPIQSWEESAKQMKNILHLL